MKTRFVRIANSQGIRLPQPLLEQTGLRGEVEISAQEDSLMIQPGQTASKQMGRRLPEMAVRSDDAVVDDPAPSLSSWDEHDWEWQ